MTSISLTFCRITYSYNSHKYKDDDEVAYYYKPYWYVISGCLNQFINFIVYSILLYLNEIGLFNRCFIKIKSSNSEFDFSEESVAEDFYAYNNLRNPLLYMQNINNNNNQKSMNNNMIINNNNNFENSNDIDTNSQNNINNINNNIDSENILNQNNQINDYNNNLNSQENSMNPFAQEEINRIGTNPNLTTKIEGLCKTYFYCCKRNVRVVNNLYLGLEPNEKFGLLGFNGSGKTTTFRAITNELIYEKGAISLFRYDGKTEFDKIRPLIGYCPQENPLFDYMKVREIISFYLHIKQSDETVELKG